MERFTPRYDLARRRHQLIAVVVTAAIVTLSLASGRTATMPVPLHQNTQVRTQEPQLPGNEPEQPDLHKWERKQRKELLKSNFEKMQQDARELAQLAKSLEEDLSKSNENVLSLRIVDRADKIEKLAKKIKNSAKGF